MLSLNKPVMLAVDYLKIIDSVQPFRGTPKDIWASPWLPQLGSNPRFVYRDKVSPSNDRGITAECFGVMFFYLWYDPEKKLFFLSSIPTGMAESKFIFNEELPPFVPVIRNNDGYECYHPAYAINHPITELLSSVTPYSLIQCFKNVVLYENGCRFETGTIGKVRIPISLKRDVPALVYNPNNSDLHKTVVFFNPKSFAGEILRSIKAALPKSDVRVVTISSLDTELNSNKPQEDFFTRAHLSLYKEYNNVYPYSKFLPTQLIRRNRNV